MPLLFNELSTAMAPTHAQPEPPLTFTTSPAVDFINVPRSAFLASRPRIKRLMTGAIVFRQTSDKNPAPVDQLLLVRRAASDSYPHMWETPGGSVDESDATLAAGAARELWEETGLRATHVACVVGMSLDDSAFEVAGLGIEPSAEVAQLDEDGVTVTFLESGSIWGKSTVIIEVESTNEIKVTPEEHSDWAWVSEQDVRRGWTEGDDGKRRRLGFVSEAVIRTLLDAFRRRKEMRTVRN